VRLAKKPSGTSFFSRINVIDDVVVDYPDATNVRVTLNAIPLAQFRPSPIPGESYTVTWAKNGVVDPTLNNIYNWGGTRAAAAGPWAVTLNFTTPEVRSDPNRLLSSRITFTI